MGRVRPADGLLFPRSYTVRRRSVGAGSPNAVHSACRSEAVHPAAGVSRRSGAAIAAAAAPGSGALVMGRPMTRRSAPARSASSGVAVRAWSCAAAPAGRTPGVIRVTSGPTSARTAATSLGEQTSPRAPADTASTASRRTASGSGPVIPIRSRSAGLSEVSRVTAAIIVDGAASTAAWITSGPPAACTVSTSGCSRATARAAPATVAGMSCSFRSRKTLTPLAPRIDATIPGPYRRYSSRPTLTVLTCGVTSPAHRAAVSRLGASRATAIGAGWVNVPPWGPGITLQRAPGEPPPRRGARLVGQPDDVRQALDPPAGQLFLKLAEDPDAGGRVMEDRRPDADHGRAGQDELQRVPAGAHPAHPDDRHVAQRRPHLPDAPHRDRADRRAGQAAGDPGQHRAHRDGVDRHAEQRVDHRQPVGARRHAGTRDRDDVGDVRR